MVTSQEIVQPTIFSPNLEQIQSRPREGPLTRRKVLLSALGSLLVLFIVIVIFAFSFHKESSSTQKLLHSISEESVERCQDFYQYACGGWTKEKRVQLQMKQQLRTSMIDEMGKDNLVLLRNLIDGLPDQYYNGIGGQIKNSFNSCLVQANNNTQTLDTSEPLHSAKNEGHRDYHDRQVRIDPLVECLGMISSHYPEMVAHLFVQAHYLDDPATARSVKHVADALRETFQTAISSLSWVDAESNKGHSRPVV
ncbi:neprilysin-2-like [Folsomia candida]|uniref:neprilysin-2-like n=1 Tax=Folsomia candida TaxID=158441 RepID=UPI0016051F67|nr:neprilysin-2-like [Folsomia candida]XP_035716653.1 neprilysin-2-like [Folsomia candida]